MKGALPSRIASRSTGSARPSISRKMIPGTSVGAIAPCRFAIRRVTLSVYSSSSFAPRIAWSTRLTAEITSAARSASPKDATWMSSGEHVAGDLEHQRIRHENQQEARDQHERQPERRQHGRQDGIEDRR